MGQFLGFSHLYSSLVALVRNLYIGYVSPQYHVVFNDKYETIFNAGMSDDQFNKLCNLLFDSSNDWYTKEEYNGDGDFLYKPPPLNEVWLSKSEKRDHCDALEQQHWRCNNFENQLAADS